MPGVSAAARSLAAPTTTAAPPPYRAQGASAAHSRSLSGTSRPDTEIVSPVFRSITNRPACAYTMPSPGDNEVALIARADNGIRRRVDVDHRRALGRDHLPVGRVRLEEVGAAVEFADRVAVRVDERGDEERPLVSVRDFERTRIRVADGIHEGLVEHDRASKQHRLA
jgi:hypothetical protein